MIQQTSLTAYELMRDKLSRKQRDVYCFLEGAGQPLSNREIAEGMEWEINTVTPRVLELRSLGLVENKGVKVFRGRTANVWGVAEDDKQRRLF